MSAARTPFGSDLVMIADYAGDKLPPSHSQILYLAADGFDALVGALQTLVKTCEQDEAQGFHSALRTYVLEIAKPALEQVSA